MENNFPQDTVFENIIINIKMAIQRLNSLHTKL